ncbi:MAG TPA: hypothetical protein VJ824_16080 [Bacillota bacterium]|nr:hypothetical protein [Bacillota bacterium]
MKKTEIHLAEHLEKWGCDNVITKAAVLELLKMLGHQIENGKIKVDH